MADLITVSVASMLNTSRATAASAMLRVSSKKKIYACAFGGGNILLAQIGGGRNDSAQYFEIEMNKSTSCLGPPHIFVGPRGWWQYNTHY